MEEENRGLDQFGKRIELLALKIECSSLPNELITLSRAADGVFRVFKEEIFPPPVKQRAAFLIWVIANNLDVDPEKTESLRAQVGEFQKIGGEGAWDELYFTPLTCGHDLGNIIDGAITQESGEDKELMMLNLDMSYIINPSLTALENISNKKELEGVQEAAVSFLQIFSCTYLVPNLDRLVETYTQKGSKVRFGLAMLRSVVKDLVGPLDLTDPQLPFDTGDRFKPRAVDAVKLIKDFTDPKTGLKFIDRRTDNQVKVELELPPGPALVLVSDEGDLYRIVFDLLTDIAGHASGKDLVVEDGKRFLPVKIKLVKEPSKESSDIFYRINFFFPGQLEERVLRIIGTNDERIGKLAVCKLIKRIWKLLPGLRREPPRRLWRWKNLKRKPLKFSFSALLPAA